MEAESRLCRAGGCSEFEHGSAQGGTGLAGGSDLLAAVQHGGVVPPAQVLADLRQGQLRLGPQQVHEIGRAHV